MVLMRALTLQCLKYNILIRSSYLASYCNKLADALSRGRVQKFKTLAPDADQQPTPTPEAHALLCALKSLA